MLEESGGKMTHYLYETICEQQSLCWIYTSCDVVTMKDLGDDTFQVSFYSPLNRREFKSVYGERIILR